MSFRKASSLSGKRLILKTTAIVGFSVLVVFVVLFSVQGLMIQQGVLEEQKLLVSQQAFLVAELFDARILEASTLLELYAINPDTVEELAQETVAKALRHFHDDVLVPGKWDYRRGATLRTYFIGQCLIRFANVYRRWWAEEVRHGRAMSTDPHDARQLADRPVESPEARLVQQDQVARALSRVCNPNVQRALVLHGAGMTYTEIAYDLHVTPKAVERMIANERDRMRKRGIA